MTTNDRSAFTRRGFIGLAGGVAATTLLAACTGGSGGSSSYSGAPIKFWNMPWGTTAMNTVDKKITLAYKPASGLPPATYQVVQWATYQETFSSAIASNTGPAVSSGSDSQAFQFAHQGKIAYADNLLESWKKNGLYDDFLPGLLDTMKTDQGYVAVPYNLDVRVMWYNPSVLKQAGVESPTTWAEYKSVCAALKKIGVYGLGIGAGAGNYIAFQAITAFMINNGGGYFNAKQEPECVTDANVEAVEFLVELVQSGYSDPAAASYTTANAFTQWSAKKWALGFDTAGLPSNVGGTVGPTLLVGDPMTSASGKKGGLYFPNNIMMYKHTPTQKGSEAFLTYYFKNMKPLWTQNTGIGLPPLKSIAATSEFKANANNVKILNDWNPVFKTLAAPGGAGLFYNVANTVDGTQQIQDFAQAILGGKTDAKTALTNLQNSIEPLMK